MKEMLEEIRIKAASNEQDRWQLRETLKDADNKPEILVYAQELLKKYSYEISCTDCGNCCRENIPIFTKGDVERIADELNSDSENITEEYFHYHSKFDVYIMNQVPCPFQQGNICTVYSSRAEGCRAYPEMETYEQLVSIGNIIKNYSVCPVIFNIYEKLADKLQ